MCVDRSIFPVFSLVTFTINYYVYIKSLVTMNFGNLLSNSIIFEHYIFMVKSGYVHLFEIYV
jgi:hypothetical protein